MPTFKKSIILFFCLFVNLFILANEENHYANSKFSRINLELIPDYEENLLNLEFDLELDAVKEENEKVGRVKFRKTIFSMHIGYSPYHGFFGIEYQWQMISLNIGVTDHLNGGIKFYLKRGLKDSLYFGGFATFIDKYGVIGSSVGYRWILKSGLTINLGIGWGIFIEEDSNSDVSTPMIVPSFSVGWSF